MKNILVLTGQNEGQDVRLLRQDDGSIQFGFAGNAPIRPLLDELASVTELVLGIDGSRNLKLSAPDLIVNLIGNGDTNRRSLGEADSIIKPLAKPVINQPQQVLRTGRQGIAELGADIVGLVAPPVITIRPRRLKEIEALWRDGGIPGEFIIRPLSQHGGKSLLRVRSEADLAALEQLAFDGQAFGISPFIDYQSADGRYRKYRLVFIDGVAYPRHLIIHNDWMVHSHSRNALMHRHDLQAEEKRFLNGPQTVLGEAAWAGLHELVRRTKLEFVGADFTLLPDGRALLFECNACMNVLGSGAGGGLPYLTPVVERIEQALRAMVEQRLDAPGRQLLS